MIAIFGAAGAIGCNTAAELVTRGAPFCVVGRSEERLKSAFGSVPGALLRPADLADVVSATKAAAGVTTILYAVGLPYPKFDQHPVLMRNTIEAAARAGVQRIVVVSSVYSYGKPRTPTVSEDHPREPEAFKGKMRKEQEDAALQAHSEGRVRALVLRLPDFYGPHAELSLAYQVLDPAAKGKKATWLGSPDLPHEFIYVPDAARVISDLLLRDDLDGSAWNAGGVGPITGREFMTLAYGAAGATPKWRTVNRFMLRVGGLFNPLLRELVELYYLNETPVILDDSRLAHRLGTLHKTSYEQGIRDTIHWLRTRQ